MKGLEGGLGRGIGGGTFVPGNCATDYNVNSSLKNETTNIYVPRGYHAVYNTKSFLL